MTTRSTIRTLRFVASDGTTRVRLHVQCPRTERSTGLDQCSRCPRAVTLGAADDEGRPAVECAVADGGGPRDTVAATVGEVLRLETLCVSADALGGEVTVLGPGRACIVDARTGALRGVLDWERASAEHPWTPVTESMVPAVQVHERATLDDALHAMVRGHARALAVTTAEGTLIGMVDDLAILRWCAAHRGS